MRRCTAFATALALTAGLSLPAHAEPGEALDRLLDGGAMESLVLRALSGVDFDAMIAGFEHSAQAAAEGRAPADATLEEMEAAWQQAKRAEAAG